MEYQFLGKSDLNISRIGFGCMSLKPDQKDFNDIIHAAMDQGINYFDTADLYDKGENEILLGKAFKGKRDKVIIASKAGNQWREDGSGWDWNPRKEYILKCADDSLRRLQTDYIDLFQLHGGTMDDNIDESIEAFEILLQQGKIRYYGLSSIRPNVIRKHVEYGKLTSVMIQYSLLDRRPEESILSYLKENDIGVVARGSVGTGLLLDKPAIPYLNWSEKEVAHAANVVKKVAIRDSADAQIAIQYVLQHPAIASAIVGMHTMKQLEDAIKAIALPPLSNFDMDILQNEIPVNFYKEHR
ncbi:MAG: aldo/keto reductase [Ginsengibacter sp.]